MKRTWIALTLAPVLAVTLTSCGSMYGTGTTTGTADQTNNGLYGGTTGRAGYSTTAPYNGYTATRRTAYDYLNDGRYAANENGQVSGRVNTAGRDLTQGARDLVRGAGNTIDDVGTGIRNATDDGLNR